jgi:L-seryl-tRNA(Ser) seleniumtransferase
MLDEPPESVRERARQVAARLPGSDVVAVAGAAGGGTQPGGEVPSFAVRLAGRSPDALAAALRTGARPVLARIEVDAVLLDLRTVAATDVEALVEAAGEALARSALDRGGADSARDGASSPDC